MIFEIQPYFEDPTKQGMNENSFSVASDFGGGFYYHFDEGEELKHDARQQGAPLPYRKNNH